MWSDEDEIDRAELAPARRVVVKVGSSSVSGTTPCRIPDACALSLARLHAAGAEVILVSSGAIATGVPFLNLADGPRILRTQQAAAAVGQNILVNRYQRALSSHEIIAGQVLLTAHDIDNPTHRGNARRAIERLLQLGILPIINENDTVATHEIRFGDNDRLAALVARLIGADRLVLLSDVDSLYTAPPTVVGRNGSRTCRMVTILRASRSVPRSLAGAPGEPRPRYRPRGLLRTRVHTSSSPRRVCSPRCLTALIMARASMVVRRRPQAKTEPLS